MSISLLDNSLKVSIYFDRTDSDYDDNICVCVKEDCPENERLMKAGETNIYVTPEEAGLLILELQKAIEKSCLEAPHV